ncbi:MAG TPA: DUF4293 domain-containing protein [Prolixibacteraceae bacterium]|nr:DUF4293 domain-containing protein [Prolixibacteraceae bacterium]HPS13245.1 DUF4293 domain-containing protein [Prolixibacteraceae bacterium]
MIQRIQTLYLSLALIMMGFLLVMPMGGIAVGEKVYSFSSLGTIESMTGLTVSRAWYIFAVAAIILVVQALAIFAYKSRKRQMKLVLANVALMLVFVVVAWFTLKSSAKALGEGISSFNMPAVFPIVSMILNYMAYRYIRKDDELVKSVDRIR